MSALPFTGLDRRNYPRFLLNRHISYKLKDDTSFYNGTIVNISETGALINVDRKFDIDSHIILEVTPEKEDEAPVKLCADIIREANFRGDFAYSYGCIILDVEL